MQTQLGINTHLWIKHLGTLLLRDEKKDLTHVDCSSVTQSATLIYMKGQLRTLHDTYYIGTL